MRILSIDQSYTSSGIIVFENGDIIHAERYTTDKKLDVYIRANMVAEHVLKLVTQFNCSIVGIEGLAFGMRGSATRDLAGLQFAIIIELSVKNNYKVDIIPPLTVKKFATGNGRAKKDDLLQVTPDPIVDMFKDDLNVKKTTGLMDMVDAYWIGKVVDFKQNNKKK